MKNNFTLTLMISLVFLVSQVIGQTVTNVEVLNKLADEFSAEWEVKTEKVKQYAEENNVPIQFDDNGRTFVMVDVVDGIPQYYVTYNIGSAHTTRADEVWPGSTSGLEGPPGQDLKSLGGLLVILRITTPSSRISRRSSAESAACSRK